jgi:hypothetical protein
MGKGVHERRAMSKLEEEAERFMAGKYEAFKDGLEAGTDELRIFLKDNLWQSHELEQVLDKIVEAELWAKLTARKYGIK